MTMHPEKEKRKQQPARRRWLKHIFVACLIATWLIFLALNAYVDWRLRGDELNHTLDDELVPTAEYLLEHPMPTPMIREIYFNGDNTHIWIVVSELERDDFCEKFLHNSEIYINGQRVGIMRGLPARFPGACIFEANEEFSGLYLVELQLKENVFSVPFLTHRWAIQIP
jgi:hypothetical protein